MSYHRESITNLTKNAMNITKHLLSKREFKKKNVVLSPLSLQTVLNIVDELFFQAFHFLSFSIVIIFIFSHAHFKIRFNICLYIYLCHLFYSKDIKM